MKYKHGTGPAHKRKGESHSGKLSIHKPKGGHGKNHMQHPSHGQHNTAIGLPHDVFDHEGESYGPGVASRPLPEVCGPSSGGGYEGGGPADAGMGDNHAGMD